MKKGSCRGERREPVFFVETEEKSAFERGEGFLDAGELVLQVCELRLHVLDDKLPLLVHNRSRLRVHVMSRTRANEFTEARECEPPAKRSYFRGIPFPSFFITKISTIAQM